MIWFVYLLQNDYYKIWLVNTFITPCNCYTHIHDVCLYRICTYILVVKTFKIYSLGNSQPYATVLLSIVTVLCIGPQGLAVSLLEICTFDQCLLIPTPGPGSHHSAFA